MAGQQVTDRVMAPGAARDTHHFNFDPGTTQRVWLTAAFSKRTAIERVTVQYDVNNGGALTGNLVRVAPGQAITTNTDVTSPTTTGNATAFNFNGTANLLQSTDPTMCSAGVARVTFIGQTATANPATPPSENIIEVGERLAWEFSAAPAAGLGNVTISVDTTEIIM
jgi:hypothetical protein